MPNEALVGGTLPRLEDLALLPPPAAGTVAPSTATETGVDVTDVLGALLGPPGVSLAPVRRAIPGHSLARTDTGTTIVFPSLPAGHCYVVRHPVRIPEDRNLRVAAPAPEGARIRALDRQYPVFISGW